jgi:hypothetical protein
MILDGYYTITADIEVPQGGSEGMISVVRPEATKAITEQVASFKTR